MVVTGTTVALGVISHRFYVTENSLNRTEMYRVFGTFSQFHISFLSNKSRSLFFPTTVISFPTAVDMHVLFLSLVSPSTELELCDPTMWSCNI